MPDDYGSCWCCGQYGIVTPAVSQLGMCASCRGRSPSACQKAHTGNAKPPAEQVQAWKQAVAKHNAALRNRRGKRPGKPITGIRANPGRAPGT